jgi:Tfp pilus assembly protein PilN
MFERINLVPQQVLAKRIKKITPLVLVGLLLLGCPLVFGLGQRLESGNKQLKKDIALLEQQKAEQKALELAVAQLSAKINALQEEEKNLRKTVVNLLEVPKKKQRYSELLLAIAEMLPPTARCEKIVLDEVGGQISGKATEYKDLPSFVEKLNTMHRFHSASLQVLNQSNEKDNELFAFTVVFGLRSQK